MATILREWYDAYLSRLASACGGDDVGAPVGADEALDNTKHTLGCTLAATPMILAALVGGAILKRIVCGKSQMRQLYSPEANAPELELVSVTGSAKPQRRVETYATDSRGRLVQNVRASSRASSSSSREKHSAPRGKRHDPELQPVLWKR